jgi:hypothetical protein
MYVMYRMYFILGRWYNELGTSPQALGTMLLANSSKAIAPVPRAQGPRAPQGYGPLWL